MRDHPFRIETKLTHRPVDHDKPPFRSNAETVANEEHADHQFGID